MAIKQYYNVPLPVQMEGIAAVCVCAVYEKKDSGKAYLRFLIRRDLSVRLKSITVVCRFSDKSIRLKDEANHYQSYRYSGKDINTLECIVWTVNGPDSIPNGCTAVVAKILMEDGEEQSFFPKSFTDPVVSVVDVTDDSTLSDPLRDYLICRKSMRKSAKQRTVESTKASEFALNPLLSPAQKAGVATVIEEPDVQTMEKAVRKYKKNKLFRHRVVQTVSGILMIAVLTCGVVFLGNQYKPQPKVIDTVFTGLLEQGRYGDAYKTALDNNDTEGLQNVCRTASAEFLFAKDYENAYLYACAAPNPFEGEVIDAFVSLLIAQNRQEEAYNFLKDFPQYTSAMQTVCQSVTERCLASGDYAGAYFYAEKAPQSLATYVLEKMAEEIIQDNRVNEAIFDALKQLDDSQLFDRMVSVAAEKLLAEKSYREAAATACQIRDENRCMTEIKDICNTGMNYFMGKNDVKMAAELYEFCAPMMDDVSCTVTVQSMIDYSKIHDNPAGVIYFTFLKGGDTSGLEIASEEESIRASRALTWFLMTADQKRAYHAREMDIYKEAFRIEEGSIGEITDAVSVAVSEYMAVVLRDNGTVTSLYNDGHNRILDLPDDSDIVQIDTGREHVVLLHDDGTVTAVGSNASGQCGVDGWTEVTEIAAGADFTAGLRANGTLYACGSHISGQCDVDGITDVIDIAACDRTLIMLKSDGSVALLGDISMNLKQAASFTDVRRIRAGGCCIIAETYSGTYMLAQGSYNANCGSVATWKNLREFAAGSLCIGRIEQNGMMKLEGDGAPITHPGYEPNGQ